MTYCRHTKKFRSMEFLYRLWEILFLIFTWFLSFFLFRFVGPLNFKNPSESFALQKWLLTRMGLWDPENNSAIIQFGYTCWSILFRGFFMYAYTLSQILVFQNIQTISVRYLRRSTVRSYLMFLQSPGCCRRNLRLIDSNRAFVQNWKFLR